MPSQKTLSDKVIPALYNNIKDTKVLRGLNDAKFVALTSDYWTSRVNQSYISITAKTKSDWRLEPFVVESKEMPGSHKAEHLVKAIKECMSDWNFGKSNISCMTIDNASNIVKAVEHVLKWSYLPYFLTVKAGLAIPRVQKVVSKGSNIVAHLRRTNCSSPPRAFLHCVHISTLARFSLAWFSTVRNYLLFTLYNLACCMARLFEACNY